MATPAMARERIPAAQRSAEGMARTLSDPEVQDGVAAIMGDLANALLDTRVGPLARYTDPQDDVRPDDTLGALVRRDDPGFDRNLRDQTRGAVATAGTMAGDVAAMSGEMNATLERLRRVLKSTGNGKKSRSSYDN
ncbi:hypothetical protein [Sphingomonas sp. ERG5]|uniref:hypothetical protein n=1 Tax=Sphingomonas sp. ERG5 TaxID=1381597 RepID=UPI0013649C55|nr:hypothetical protein [Sphingomonas sp. ERG5]